MGQKVNPHGFRVGVIKDWNAKWYADKEDFADNIVEDQKIREFIKERLTNAGISEVRIERAAKRVKVNIHTAKPGVVIGRGGAGIETLKKDMTPIVDGKTLVLNIVEVKNVDQDAKLLAENVAGQLERRISYRRAMKMTIQRSMRSGVEGIKIQCSGRLGGAEIARTEFYREGSIPLQTLRADIQYGFAEANTTYGKIGVKVWIYKGEILPEVKTDEEEKNA